MSNDALDLAFARHVRQIGLITPEQVNAALQAQSKSTQLGKPISVSEAFVQLGLLTASQRDTLEKKVREQQAGVQQLGPYKLMKKLGEGGMGAVYLALDPSGQRHVAVKVLPRHLGTNAEFVKRFKREAEAATKLKHANIIGAFAAGEDLGYHFYVMEYCEGKPLDSILAVEKRLPVAQALSITLQAARGLKYAHDSGIIHRDVKPSNIIMTVDGTAKILDLGLSKNLEESTVSFKTVTGAVLGTPHYISPEQAQGEKNVDGRTDIYSLGATLYHLVTGQVPFDGATALEILSKHVNTVLPNPQDLREDIPDNAVHVLLRMMAKEPRDRYPDCAQLIADLEEVTSGRTPKTAVLSAALTTIAPSKKALHSKKRPATIRRMTAARTNKTPLFAGIAVAAAAVVVLGVAISGGGTPVESPMRPTPPVKPPVVGKAPDAPAPAFDVATWEKSVAELSPEAQIRAVVARLRELNPGYDGSERHEAGHGRISRLELSHVALRDLSPLRALPRLTQLDLTGTSVTDLSPLRDLKLISLSCVGTKGIDLRSLKALKELKILSLKSSPVKDLAPLEGMELWQLNLRGTSVPDLAPVGRMKLRELLCDFDAGRDTEALRVAADLERINEMPVDVFWKKDKGSESRVVAVPPPTPAPAPEDPARPVVERLKQANPDFDGQSDAKVEGGAIVELTISALGVTDLSPLRGLTGLRRLDVSGYWDPAEKKEYRSALKDLSPLRGLKLESLRVHHTSVADLEPLRGMKLETLDADSSGVRDLAPLKGMALKRLGLSYTLVKDLSPLEGMPIAEMRCISTGASDFSVLKSLQLRNLLADLDPQKDRTLVNDLKLLQWLNGAPVADFLKPGVKPAPVPPPVAKPPPAPVQAGPWKNAVDLIAIVDPARDAVKGAWRKQNGKLVSEFGENSCLRIPYEPPPEYDFKTVFTRASGECCTAQFLVRDGRSFYFEVGGYGNNFSGFALVGGKGSKDNPTHGNFVPKDGVKLTMIVQVRRDRVTALMDDKKVAEWVPSMGEISTDDNFCLDLPNLLGLGNCESNTTFETVQVREVTGKGRIRTTLTTPIDAAFLRTVASVGAQDQLKKVADKLRELNPLYDGEYNMKVEGNAVVEFEVKTDRIVDGWPIRALQQLRRLNLESDSSVLYDITFLKGLKLQELGLAKTRAADLTPLAGMPLLRLQISGTPVRDLTPLLKLPLAHLECDRIGTSEFSPLKSIRTLKTINDQPAADFLKSARESWTPIFDGRTTDFLRLSRGWKVERGAVVNEPDEANAAQTLQEFENGELRIRFEGKDLGSLYFVIRQSDRGGYNLLLDKNQCKSMEGRPHDVVFLCQGDRVTAALDGKAVSFTKVEPSKRGCLQFNAVSGTIRVLSIEYRAAP
jgi:serine/threonine-protein kinase